MSGLRLATFGLFAHVTNSDAASMRFHDIVSAARRIPLDHALSDLVSGDMGYSLMSHH